MTNTSKGLIQTFPILCPLCLRGTALAEDSGPSAAVCVINACVDCEEERGVSSLTLPKSRAYGLALTENEHYHQLA